MPACCFHVLELSFLQLPGKNLGRSKSIQAFRLYTTYVKSRAACWHTCFQASITSIAAKPTFSRGMPGAQQENHHVEKNRLLGRDPLVVSCQSAESFLNVFFYNTRGGTAQWLVSVEADGAVMWARTYPPQPKEFQRVTGPRALRLFVAFNSGLGTRDVLATLSLVCQGKPKLQTGWVQAVEFQVLRILIPGNQVVFGIFMGTRLQILYIIRLRDHTNDERMMSITVCNHSALTMFDEWHFV